MEFGYDLHYLVEYKKVSVRAAAAARDNSTLAEFQSISLT